MYLEETEEKDKNNVIWHHTRKILCNKEIEKELPPLYVHENTEFCLLLA